MACFASTGAGGHAARLRATVTCAFALLPLVWAIACGSGGSSAPVDGGGPAPSTTDTSVPPPPFGIDATAPEAGDAIAEASPGYDAVQVKSSHNSYERDEPLFDQLVWHRLRSLELDIHNGKRFQSDPTNDFYVYHVDAPALDSTSCRRLSDCVRALSAFHAQVPNHEVATIFIDVKDDFEAGHTAQILDDVLSGVGRSAIFTPADWLARCPGARTLRAATAAPCKAPSLDELRGKFVFALTGGTACGATKLAKYVEGGAEKRIGFVAPETTGACSISEISASHPHVVFLNFAAGVTASAGDAAKARYLTRVYDLNDEASFVRAKDAGAHFLGTNKVNVTVDPWANTAQASGYPFRCLGDCAMPRERSDLFALEATGGDLVGAADGALFAHESAVTQAVTWTSAISVASSHVDRAAEGCLMARASLDIGAPFFAVCRPADNDTVRVLRRETANANVATTTATYATEDVFSSESTFFARLTATPAGAGTRVKGEGSIDGKTWVTIDERTFAMPLVLQGVAANARAADPVRSVFAGLVRESGAAKERGRPKLTRLEKIGLVNGKIADDTSP